MAGEESIRDQAGRQNPAETSRRLLEAAAAAFVQHGYDKARVSEIARNAGVTVGAVYARWPNKTAVMVAALDYLFEQILPEQRVETIGLQELPLTELVKLWGTELLEPDSPRDVFVQVFGSARNNAEVCTRLGLFLDEQYEQISKLVDRAKDEGLADPELSTAALVLFMRALGLGVHLIMSSQLDKRNVPSPEDWEALIARFIEAAAPATA